MVFLWILAIYFSCDSLFRLFYGNFNLGTFFIYCITVALWAYVLFHKEINAFCAHGVGLWCKYIFFAGCAFALGMSIFIASNANLHQPKGDEPVVIVLGAGLRGERITTVLKERLDVTLDFFAQHPTTTIVVAGGQGMQESIPESTAMARYLVEHGVPQNQIIEEDKSTSTEENFLFSKSLLKQAGFSAQTPIVFATNRFHCYRAREYALKAGFTEVATLPAGISPSAMISCYLREVCAVLYYWVFRSY